MHYINDENEYLVNKEDFHIHAITGLLFENIVMITNYDYQLMIDLIFQDPYRVQYHQNHG